MRRDVRDLVRDAMKAGWMSTTPSDVKAVRATRARLRRHGLEV